MVNHHFPYDRYGGCIWSVYPFFKTHPYGAFSRLRTSFHSSLSETLRLKMLRCKMRCKMMYPLVN